MVLGLTTATSPAMQRLRFSRCTRCSRRRSTAPRSPPHASPGRRSTAGVQQLQVRIRSRVLCHVACFCQGVAVIFSEAAEHEKNNVGFRHKVRAKNLTFRKQNKFDFQDPICPINFSDGPGFWRFDLTLGSIGEAMRVETPPADPAPLGRPGPCRFRRRSTPIRRSRRYTIPAC